MCLPGQRLIIVIVRAPQFVAWMPSCCARVVPGQSGCSFISAHRIRTGYLRVRCMTAEYRDLSNSNQLIACFWRGQVGRYTFNC